MSAPFPTQRFRLGDRVKRSGVAPFTIDAVCVQNECVMYGALGRAWFASDDLTLASERLPYVASERLVFDRAAERVLRSTSLYRCETDAELDERRAFERAVYDALGDEA